MGETVREIPGRSRCILQSLTQIPAGIYAFLYARITVSVYFCMQVFQYPRISAWIPVSMHFCVPYAFAGAHLFFPDLRKYI